MPTRTNVTVHVLPNGLTVALVHLPGARAAHLAFALQAGSRFERPATLGVTNVLTNALFLGCSAHPTPSAHRTALGDLGELPEVDMNAGEFTVDFTVVRDVLPDAVCLLGQTIATPKFRGVEDVLHGCRMEVEEEFEDFATSGDENTTSAITALYERVYAGHPAGWPILGTPRTLAAMTPGIVKEEHARLFTGENAVLTIVGDLDGAGGAAVDDLLTIVEASFTLPRGKRTEIAPFIPQLRERTPLSFMGSDTSQPALLATGFLAPTWHDRLGPASRALLHMLGSSAESRIAKQLLAAGLCMEAVGEIGGTDFEPLAAFMLAAEVGKEGSAARTFLGILRRVMSEGVYPDELARAKRAYVRSAEAELDHPRAHATYYGLDLFRVPAADLAPEALAARMNAVTTVDVQEVARTMFAPENMVMVVDGASTRARRDIAEAVAYFSKPGVAS